MDPLQRLSEFNKQNITTKKTNKQTNKQKTRGTENNGKEKKILRELFYPFKLA